MDACNLPVSIFESCALDGPRARRVIPALAAGDPFFLHQADTHDETGVFRRVPVHAAAGAIGHSNTFGAHPSHGTQILLHGAFHLILFDINDRLLYHFCTIVLSHVITLFCTRQQHLPLHGNRMWQRRRTCRFGGKRLCTARRAVEPRRSALRTRETTAERSCARSRRAIASSACLLA